MSDKIINIDWNRNDNAGLKRYLNDKPNDLQWNIFSIFHNVWTVRLQSPDELFQSLMKTNNKLPHSPVLGLVLKIVSDDETRKKDNYILAPVSGVCISLLISQSRPTLICIMHLPPDCVGSHLAAPRINTNRINQSDLLIIEIILQGLIIE